MSWPEIRFEELYAEPSRNGVYKSNEHHGSGVKIVNMGELFGHGVIADQEMKRLMMSEKEMERCGLDNGDLLFGRRSLVEEGAGKCTLVEGLSEPTTFESSIIRVRLDQEKAIPRFYYYWFKSHIGRGAIRAIVSGVNVKGIRGSDLKNIKVTDPPFSQQKAIADILSAYDDLIENNRRRMALLEESARLLYREWFVHLRFPGHEHVPVKDGVPEGWERMRLGEVAEFRLGKMLDQKKNRGELMPYLANVNVRWGKFDLHDLREMRFEEDELDSYGLKFGDIVMCEGGEPGRCAIWTEQMPMMMIQKAIHRIRCRENMNYVFLYHSLRNLGQSGYLASLFTGATIKHLPREQLAKVSLLVPPRSLMDVFWEQVEPIENQLSLLATANRRASSARDLLLPRLMNGEIAV